MDPNHYESMGGSHTSDDRRNDAPLADDPMSPHTTLEDDQRVFLGDEEESAIGHPMPPLPERTLKERLVERERQARVETERARLKRQFALNNGGAAGEGDGLEEEESVAGTVGAGSSVAATPMEFEPPNDDEQALGYAMERFLSEKNAAPNGEENTGISPPPDVGGVVMERFLSEPMVVEPPQDLETRLTEVDDVPLTAIDDHREVEHNHFLMDQLHSHTSEIGTTTAGSIRSYSPVSESDIVVINDGGGSMENLHDTMTEDGRHSNFDGSHTPSSPLHELSSSIAFSQQSDQPRLFRLTEREIQEMAAIEEASIGNAPPSEREDEFSEVGDLVDHFRDDLEHRHLGPFSEQTRTTASFSNTTPLESHASVDGGTSNSVSSVLVMSPGTTSGASILSLTVNHLRGIMTDEIAPLNPEHRGGNLLVPQLGSLDMVASDVLHSGVINRRIRPGLVMTPPRGSTSPDIVNGVRRSISMPIIVDGFEYDKFDMGTPQSMTQDSIRDLPGDDLWSPASAMSVSPLHERKVAGFQGLSQQIDIQIPRDDEEAVDENGTLDSRYHLNYGSMATDTTEILPRGLSQNYSLSNSETKPLLREQYSGENPVTKNRQPRTCSLLLRAESIFSSIRSLEAEDIQEEANDAEKYRQSKVIARAFPERLTALLVTLLVEIPVLLMVSGGSDRLCSILGRKRYQLMMGFLPLSSAISGNCGLQASTLTTRAISHEHVTVESFVAWLRSEIGAALFLGLAMGGVLGACAFVMSGMDFAFGLTIFTAQFVSVLTAGLTGTLAPLLFTFIFKRDAGKWGGPLETAIQDIVGSFAMVILSYRLLVIFGPVVVDPSDTCGVVL